LLSLVLGSPASGLLCSIVPSEWKIIMWYGNGASGTFTSHVPTIAGKLFLLSEPWWHPAELRHKAITLSTLNGTRISAEHSLQNAGKAVA
jgi:hypothetical protein